MYELSVTCAAENHDYDAPEFKAMVEALLRAIKSEDKNLRAAAGAALVYDEHSTVFFEHLHEIVPALISSFDTDLLIDRRNRGGPAECVMIVIWLHLDACVGERFSYYELENQWSKQPQPTWDPALEKRQAWRKFVTDKRSDHNALRAYWEAWWKEHANLSAVEIGVLMIERSLRILAANTMPDHETYSMAAEWCLQKWAGPGVAVGDWAKWWEGNKQSYRGPVKRQR